MDAPNNAQVDVATNAIKAKVTADNDRYSMRDEIGARKVEYSVNPYTATFGLNNCRIKPFVKAIAALSDFESD